MRNPFGRKETENGIVQSQLQKPGRSASPKKEREKIGVLLS
jgi:hypothetical protein